MTTATATAPPPQAQQPPPQSPVDGILLAAIIAALLAHAADAPGLYRALRGPLGKDGVKPDVVKAVAALFTSFPPPRLEGAGPATKHVIDLNWTRRAQFLLLSARRIDAAMARARSRGESVLGARRAQLDAEARFYKQHLFAAQQRVAAAASIDGAGSIWGPVLGWRAVMDSAVTPDCRAADGRNFWADTPPDIGWPGTVHPRCRCHPVRPFRGAVMLRTNLKRAAA
jgi:hypothetical protein